MKRCTKCGQLQPLDNFYKAKGTRDGLRGDCKACFAARAKSDYELNREREIDRVRQWQQANPERVAATRRKRRLRPEVKRQEREYHLLRKYGITIEEYEALLDAQDGVCAICEQPPRKDISLHLDHEHETGRIRGLLCFRCNNALGDLGDSHDALWRALAHLGPRPADPEIESRIRERIQDLKRQYAA